MEMVPLPLAIQGRTLVGAWVSTREREKEREPGGRGASGSGRERRRAAGLGAEAPLGSSCGLSGRPGRGGAGQERGWQPGEAVGVLCFHCNYN